jgi:ABC-2 type transport system permease protein
MRRLVTAEFHKLATTRLWLWLLLGSVALTALYASLAIAFGDTPDNPTPPLASPGGQRTVFSVGQGAGTLLAVLAAIGLTGEFRHQTATTTFLATPNRGQVVLAKLATYALVGIGYALICIAVTIAIALPWLNAKGIQVPLAATASPPLWPGWWPRSRSSASSGSGWAR